MDAWEEWFAALGELPELPNVHNLYSKQTREGQLRLANLRRYVEVMRASKPQVLLVGEAPGYQGSYRTGVPFGSEAILLGPVNKFGLFGGPANGFERVFDDGRLWKEPTATVAQQVFDTLAEPVWSWAMFPLHPHRPGVELSNRAPNRAEIALGAEILRGLMAAAEPKRVVAMGNVAAAGLAELGIAADKVRHPSHGGATQFRAQLAALMLAPTS